MRAIVALLAVVFLLGAADPSPRFLGIARLPQAPLVELETTHTVLQSYDLPVAVASSADGGDASVRLEVARLEPILPPAARLHEDWSPLVARASLRAASDGPLSDVPLRC